MEEEQQMVVIDLGCGFDYEAINQEIAEGKYIGFITTSGIESGIFSDLQY
jgi:hypothetical protein